MKNIFWFVIASIIFIFSIWLFSMTGGPTAVLMWPFFAIFYIFHSIVVYRGFAKSYIFLSKRNKIFLFLAFILQIIFAISFNGERQDAPFVTLFEINDKIANFLYAINLMAGFWTFFLDALLFTEIKNIIKLLKLNKYLNPGDKYLNAVSNKTVVVFFLISLVLFFLFFGVPILILLK
ncbi:MAG: hypothetical protein ACD_7C00171G0003 [uncultured bacterium]|nr:MAG: hypothetical protein ACD_7C00171G0003 [uncultured bacterium]HBR79914.1 hypothetical protein [Candidatus Moranbacteria bacterium]